MVETQGIAESVGVKFRVEIERRIEGARKVGAHKTSMLQDLQRGRAMEIDPLVTVVQEMARLTGLQRLRSMSRACALTVSARAQAADMPPTCRGRAALWTHSDAHLRLGARRCRVRTKPSGEVTVKKIVFVVGATFAMISVAGAADLPRRQPVYVQEQAPIGKMPIGKSPVGKAPIGKAPGPVARRY